MSDPYAYYTPLGDRLLLFTRAEMRRAWLTERLELWHRFMILIAAR